MAAPLRQDSHPLRYGFLYKIFYVLITCLNYLNLVELFKLIARSFVRDKSSEVEKRMLSRIGIDVFICFKWALIIFFWVKGLAHPLCTAVAWYLVVTNVYTYFYNHVWSDEALNTEKYSKDRIRSRFLNLMLAIAYSAMTFAYLFQTAYSDGFNWTDHSPGFWLAIQYSFSNSLAANFDQVKPVSDLAYRVSSIQLAITFIFVTIVLSRSIPQTSSDT